MAALVEYGGTWTIFVVEAMAAVPRLAPFGSGEVDCILEWIETDNAAPFG